MVVDSLSAVAESVLEPQAESTARRSDEAMNFRVTSSSCQQFVGCVRRCMLDWVTDVRRGTLPAVTAIGEPVGDARVQRLTVADGVDLEVIRRGPEHPIDGPGWVLLHGLSSNAMMWDQVGSRLAAQGSSVVAVNQRGHGRSSKPEHGYEMATIADDLASLIASLGWDRPIIVGQSWGGNVVIETASRHRDLVSAVGCVDGGFIRLGDRFESWEACAEVLAPPMIAGTPASEVRGWIERSAADWPPEGREATMANFEIRADGTVAPWLTRERHMSVLRGLWEHDPMAAMAAVDVPISFLVADSGEAAWSRSRHAAVETAIAASADADAVWFPGAHHDVHAQRPDDVTSALLALAARARM